MVAAECKPIPLLHPCNPRLRHPVCCASHRYISCCEFNLTIRNFLVLPQCVLMSVNAMQQSIEMCEPFAGGTLITVYAAFNHTFVSPPRLQVRPLSSPCVPFPCTVQDLCVIMKVPVVLVDYRSSAFRWNSKSVLQTTSVTLLATEQPSTCRIYAMPRPTLAG